MPRHVREVNLSTREARKRLQPRKKPYYRALDEGLHLGYRKSHKGSAWVIRWYRGAGTYGTSNLAGRPDDILTADGTTTLNWSQAQATARKIFEKKQREATGVDDVQIGPYTIKAAMADYTSAYNRRGGKAPDHLRAVTDALILPALGDLNIASLSRRRIETWHQDLAKAPPRVRTKMDAEQKYREVDPTAEAERRRRSTANRVLTVLKAALNHAYHERKVSSDDAWRSVKAFRGADAARIRYLSDDESRRLVNACSKDFRPIVQAALLSGCRYGELIALTATDYNPDSGTLHIRISKSGKPRHVVLTAEGMRFFKSATASKTSNELIFTKPAGSAWGKSHQQRPFKEACKAARLPIMSFHELRHSYASRLVMKAVPLAVVASQLGHSDTRMVEKHYGHMAQSYVAKTVRAAFGTLRIVKRDNVASFRPRVSLVK